MASSARVLSDTTALGRADQALHRCEGWLAMLAGIAVFSLMLLAVVSVGGRNFFNQPLQGYVDWIEQAMPLIAFMGIAYLQREGGHIRMDMVISRLQGRALWAAEWLTVLLMLVFMGLLVWGSYAHFARSFDLSAPLWSRDSSMDIGLPLWPAKLLVPIAFSILCVRLALHLWGYGRAFINNDPTPAAVPLPISIQAQAIGETEGVTDSSQS